jgi:uncharacterized protein (TIGR02145 family)
MKKILFLAVFISIGLQACKKETKNPIALEYGTVSDVDGNTYKTVKIGDQWWMCENLRTNHFSDGSIIPEISIQGTDSIWSTLNTPALTDIDSLNGILYNQFAVQDSRKIAPVGWHIPSDEEWKTLEKSIGMSVTAANQSAWRGTNEAEKLVVKNSNGWPLGSIVFGLDNYSFSVLPMGCRTINGAITIGYNAFFWTATTATNGHAYYRYFDYQKKNIFRQTTYPQYGMSIRCVKD